MTKPLINVFSQHQLSAQILYSVSCSELNGNSRVFHPCFQSLLGGSYSFVRIYWINSVMSLDWLVTFGQDLFWFKEWDCGIDQISLPIHVVPQIIICAFLSCLCFPNQSSVELRYVDGLSASFICHFAVLSSGNDRGDIFLLPLFFSPFLWWLKFPSLSWQVSVISISSMYLWTSLQISNSIFNYWLYTFQDTATVKIDKDSVAYWTIHMKDWQHFKQPNFIILINIINVLFI